MIRDITQSHEMIDKSRNQLGLVVGGSSLGQASLISFNLQIITLVACHHCYHYHSHPLQQLIASTNLFQFVNQVVGPLEHA